MRQLRVILASALVLFLISCNKVVGKGPVVTETRNETGYQGIDLRIAADVYFKQDPEYKVEISAQKNVLDEIQTFVSNDRLVIKLVHGIRLRSHEDIRVTVSGPTMNALRVSGSGDISTTNAITTGRIDLDVSGSGSITIPQLTADYADANISGSGDIKIHGGTIRQEKLKISGSGNMDFSNVTAVKAETTTSGSGDIRLNVSEELDVRISGSGSVYYKGSPAIDTHISGSGKVVRL
jgi:hypothetical protein